MEGVLKKKIRILISAIIVAVGIIILLASVSHINDTDSGGWILVVFNIGAAFVVTGMIALFNELVFGKAGEDKKVGFRLEALEREGFSGYNKWTQGKSPKTVKFMGHAVLQSMDQGLSEDIVDVFIDKMKDGVNIEVLFYDPEWEHVEVLSTDIAGVSASVIYEKLRVSLEIAERLHDRIKKERKDKLTGHICIRMAREPISYSYHYVGYEKAAYAYVGFYFSGELGYKYPPFIVDDPEILPYFDRNFNELFARGATTTLLSSSKKRSTLSKNISAKKAHTESKLAFYLSEAGSQEDE